MPPAPALVPKPGGSDPLGIRRGGPPARKNLQMSKEKNKGNKEAKKPKKDAPKVLATANSGLGKDGTVIAGKKIK